MCVWVGGRARGQVWCLVGYKTKQLSWLVEGSRGGFVDQSVEVQSRCRLDS